MPHPCIEVTINRLSGGTLFFQMQCDALVWNVKRQVKPILKCGISTMTLFHHDMVLPNEHRLKNVAVTSTWFVLQDLVQVSSQPLAAEFTLILTPPVCAHCSRSEPTVMAMKVCARCRKTTYCSGACQALAWPLHRKICKTSTEA